MIVVADTSPLNYLVQLERVELLRVLFGQVVVPATVLTELRHTRSVEPVRRWTDNLPVWTVVALAPVGLQGVSMDLHDGEREAIQIALDRKADLILIDERMGALEAERLNLRVTGTLGVLLLAAERGLVDVRVEFKRLTEETNFRISGRLRASFEQTLTISGF